MLGQKGYRASKIVTCTRTQTNQRELHRRRTGKKPIKALSPFFSLSGGLSGIRQATIHRPNRSLHLHPARATTTTTTPAPRPPLHARTTQTTTNTSERNEAGLILSKTLAGEGKKWGTGDQ